MDGIVINAGAQGGLNPGLLVQEEGDSPSLIMSQKAVTDFVNSKAMGGASSVAVPRFEQTLTYTGDEQVPEFVGFYSDYMDIGGCTKATAAGTYEVTFVPKVGYVWPDGTKQVVTVSWTIQKAEGRCLLSQLSANVINGSSTAVAVTRKENAEITVVSANDAVAVGAVSGGEVTVQGKRRGTVTLTIFVGETANYKAASAVLEVAVLDVVQVPSQLGELTFTGVAQSPSWNGYSSSSESLTLGGTTTGVNAGDYGATFKPTDGWCWPDGSVGERTVNWTIVKATGTLTISANSLQMLNLNDTRTFTVQTNTGGTVNVVSAAAATAAASISGNTVTVTSKNYGTASITVSVGETANYTTPSPKVCSVSVTKKADLTPAQIKAIIDSGQAANVFAVGDLFPIKFNGKVSDGLTLNNETYYAAIIGINHNPSVEGNNRVHFKFPYDASGKQLAFVDSAYGNGKSSGTWFNINNNNYGAGGWAKCGMRTNVIPLFKAAMESAWSSIIKTCTKYSDNNNVTTGTTVPDTASNVTATQDDLWPLDEFEYHGKRSYANSASQNYQKQYQYYINGKTKIHYKHNSTASAAWVWARGVYVGSHNSFCIVNADGSANYNLAYNERGVALGFTV